MPSLTEPGAIDDSGAAEAGEGAAAVAAAVDGAAVTAAGDAVPLAELEQAATEITSADAASARTARQRVDDTGSDARKVLLLDLAAGRLDGRPWVGAPSGDMDSAGTGLRDARSFTAGGCLAPAADEAVE
jgi:hypothetical protein